MFLYIFYDIMSYINLWILNEPLVKMDEMSGKCSMDGETRSGRSLADRAQ
jgi:hypothetical protein